MSVLFLYYNILSNIKVFRSIKQFNSLNLTQKKTLISNDIWWSSGMQVEHREEGRNDLQTLLMMYMWIINTSEFVRLGQKYKWNHKKGIGQLGPWHWLQHKQYIHFRGSEGERNQRENSAVRASSWNSGLNWSSRCWLKHAINTGENVKKLTLPTFSLSLLLLLETNRTPPSLNQFEPLFISKFPWK